MSIYVNYLTNPYLYVYHLNISKYIFFLHI